MPRAGLSPDRVIAEAADLADEVGLARLTLAAVADRLGVRLPSLYKHIDGMPALRRALAIRAKFELAGLLAKATAGKATGQALHALAHAYRGWAHDHPGRYAASLSAPVPGDGEDLAASEAATEAVFDALAGYDLDEDTMVDGVRTLRAIIGGYLAIEQVGGFGLDRPVDASLEWALRALDSAMSTS